MIEMQRYVGALSPRQRRIFFVLDHYADAATGLFVLMSVASQCLAGTPNEAVLSALAVMLPAGLITYGINRLCKRLMPKQRRNRFYHAMVSTPARGSFPSFHSQFAATLCAAFVAAIALLAPEAMRLQASVVGALTMGIPTSLVAWSRLYLGVHDRVDVIAGLVIGTCMGVTSTCVMFAATWIPVGAIAWIQVASLAGFVARLGSIERRKRRIPLQPHSSHYARNLSR